jgi:hypothetical protein
MQDSFLIQNHSASNFDSYHKAMKKRQQSHTGRVFGDGTHSPTLKRADLLYGKVQGRRPAARDGHTGVIVSGMLIVFGGDRHHMPFNDTYRLDVKSEFEKLGM